MSRPSWPGRPTGRHAAGARGRAGEARPSPPRPSPAGPTPDPAQLLGAPTLADAPPACAPPAYVPPGAAPLVTINALGRKCPIPIIMLAERIREVPVGSVIAVLADDPAAYTDIPAWCGLKSHDCAFRTEYATGWSFGVRRRY